MPTLRGTPLTAEQLLDDLQAATLSECAENVLAALRKVPEQKGLLHAALVGITWYVQHLPGKRVATGMVDTGRQAARGRGEFLDLFDTQVMFLEKECDIDHVVKCTSGM